MKIFCLLNALYAWKVNQLIAAILPLLKGGPQHLGECIHHLKHPVSDIIYNHHLFIIPSKYHLTNKA